MIRNNAPMKRRQALLQFQRAPNFPSTDFGRNRTGRHDEHDCVRREDQAIDALAPGFPREDVFLVEICLKAACYERAAKPFCKCAINPRI